MKEKIYDAAMGLLKLSMLKSKPFRVDRKIKKSAFQIKVLERVFALTALPSTSMQTDLALLLKIPQRSVQVWFQNARQARKKRCLREEGVASEERSNEDCDLQDISVENIVKIIDDVRLSS